MKTKYKVGLGIGLAAAILAVTGWYLHGHLIPVLQPAGEIGNKERNLIAFCAAISLVVVAPVFTLLGVFAWKYREGNHTAKYSPELEGSRVAETIWWLVPSALLLVIGVITWRSSYALDPYKTLASNKPTLHVQVVALDWKWLFIYPGQDVASVNQVAVPVGTPVDFEITSDTVMNSFWVPQLGGQMYAMPGMNTQLNLVADKAGSYNGSSANISGKGFADMKFTVQAMPQADFDTWVISAHKAAQPLTTTSYAKLAKDSENNPVSHYSSVQDGLYDRVVFKYMSPINTAQTAEAGA